jgi:energy-coupling factor transport system substrate-specific component
MRKSCPSAPSAPPAPPAPILLLSPRMTSKPNRMSRSAIRLVGLSVLGAGVNLAMAQLAQAFALPFVLDAGGTVLASVLGGWWPGVIAGLVTQGAFALRGAVWLLFVPVHMAVAFYSTRAVRAGWFERPLLVVSAGLLIGAAATVVSWPLEFVAFGGVIGSLFPPIRDVLTALGVPLRWAAYAARFGSELLDKVLIALAVFGVLRVSRRVRHREGQL